MLNVVEKCANVMQTNPRNISSPHKRIIYRIAAIDYSHARVR